MHAQAWYIKLDWAWYLSHRQHQCQPWSKLVKYDANIDLTGQLNHSKSMIHLAWLRMSILTMYMSTGASILASYTSTSVILTAINCIDNSVPACNVWAVPTLWPQASLASRRAFKTTLVVRVQERIAHSGHITTWKKRETPRTLSYWEAVNELRFPSQLQL